MFFSFTFPLSNILFLWYWFVIVVFADTADGAMLEFAVEACTYQWYYSSSYSKHVKKPVAMVAFE